MNQVFAGNQNILNTITGPATKTVEAGPGQYGFTPQEDAARKTNIAETAAANTREVSNKAREAGAAQGGGNISLPSGAADAQTAQIAEWGAGQKANALQQETAQGYDIGRQNFNQANQTLATAPGELENPATAMENPALAGTQELTKSADAITASNRSWEKDITGALGGVLDVATAGLSGKLGKIGDAADSAVNSL